eukprot:scpid97694/ scgid26210/ 
MKNLTMILLGVAMVACFSLGLAHAKPSVLSDITENEARWGIEARSADKSVAVQELVAALAKNLVDMASYVNSNGDCYHHTVLYERQCGPTPTSHDQFIRLSPQCQQGYRTLAEFHCPHLPRQ